MIDDSEHFSGYALHVHENLVELGQEFGLRRVERHSVLLRVIADNGVDTILLVLVLHLKEDQIGTFLVDLDLGLNNHIVDKSDECS